MNAIPPGMETFIFFCDSRFIKEFYLAHLLLLFLVIITPKSVNEQYYSLVSVECGLTQKLHEGDRRGSGSGKMGSAAQAAAAAFCQ